MFERKKVNVQTTVLIATLSLGISMDTQAGNPLEKLCWNAGVSTWVLNVGSFSSENFELHGYDLVPSDFCGASNRVPLTGTATVSGNTVTLGLWGAANEPGKCVGASFKILLDLNTLAGSGSFKNQDDVEGTINLAPTTCPAAGAVLHGSGPALQGSGAGSPYLVR